MSDLIKQEESNLERMKGVAEYYINSKFLPESVKSPEQAVLIMQKGRELGFQPLQSFDAIDVIMGKTTLKPKYLGL